MHKRIRAGPQPWTPVADAVAQQMARGRSVAPLLGSKPGFRGAIGFLALGLLGGAAPAAAGLHPVWPVLDEVVIASRAQAAWGGGAVEVIADPGDFNDWYLLRQAVDPARLPRADRAWLGRRVEVRLADGRACPARVAELHLVAGAAPTPRQEREYRALLERHPTPRGPAYRRWLRRLWAASQPVLVASTEPSCPRGRWAWDEQAGVTAYAVRQPVPRGSPLDRAALAAFRALAEYRAIQARWERARRSRRSSATWDTVDGDPVVWRFTLPTTTLAVVGAGVARSLTGLEAELGAVWEMRGSAGAPVLVLRHGQEARPRALEAIAALEGGSELAFLEHFDGRDRRGSRILRETARGRLREDRSARCPY